MNQMKNNMSIPDILNEIRSLKQEIGEIKENLRILQDNNEKTLEKHSAIILASVKKTKFTSYQNRMFHTTLEFLKDKEKSHLLQKQDKIKFLKENLILII